MIKKLKSFIDGHQNGGTTKYLGLAGIRYTLGV